MNRSTQDPSRFPYYTAKELNNHVGMYESTTWWKRANNNPYYATRIYQSRLRDLGCISMVKRGLWKINAPIPEWFGSFHFNGLKGNLSDPSNIYWNSLPANHKVNPWKEEAPFSKMHKHIHVAKDHTTCTIQDIPVTPALFDLTCDCKVYAAHVNGDYDADASYVVEYVCKLNGVVIPDSVVLSLSKAYGFDLDECTKLVSAEALSKFHALVAPKPLVQEAAKEPSKERLYTMSEVKDILKNFTEKLQTSVISNVEDLIENIDESDVVDLDFESYNRTFNVDLDYRSITHTVSSGIKDTFADMLDEMEEALEHIDSKS